MTSLKYIRIQRQLHNMHCDENGNLILPNNSDNDRNTVHFAVNSLVDDHAYGKFNYDSNGNFIGKVVIITDPSDIKTPAALNQVDTWFRYDYLDNKRNLNLGKSILVIPNDMLAPEGANVIHYNGTIEDRNKVVEEYMKSFNIPLEHCGLREWAGYTTNQAKEWAENIVRQHYPHKNIYIGMHDGSIDDTLETNRAKSFLQSFKSNNTRVHFDGVDYLYVDLIKKYGDQGLIDIDNFLGSLDKQERHNIEQHYLNIRENIVAYVQEAQEIDNLLSQKNYINYIKQTISDFPGIGSFFIAAPNDKEPTQVSPTELIELALHQKINNDYKIWRNGYEPDWTTIGKTTLKLNENFKFIKIEQEPTIQINKNSTLNKISELRAKNLQHTDKSVIKYH